MPFDALPAVTAEPTGQDYWTAVKAAYHDNQGIPEHHEHATDAERWGDALLGFVRRSGGRKVAAGRWGDIIPDTLEGRRVVVALVTMTLQAWAAKRDKRIKSGWSEGAAEAERQERTAAHIADVAAWAPWMDAERMAGIVRRASRYVYAGPEWLGQLMALTEAERQKFKAWWLVSVDGPTKEERRKLDGTRGRTARKRRSGVRTRAEYLEQFAGRESRVKPWESLGISESTYRRHKRARLAAVTAGALVTAGESEDVITEYQSPDSPAVKVRRAGWRNDRTPDRARESGPSGRVGTARQSTTVGAARATLRHIGGRQVAAVHDGAAVAIRCVTTRDRHQRGAPACAGVHRLERRFLKAANSPAIATHAGPTVSTGTPVIHGRATQPQTPPVAGWAPPVPQVPVYDSGAAGAAAIAATP
jgi:hypothetical protein